ncbi:hypothetical protein LTR85_000982 [Meristemomyces frigidus]|nr:hypothetical protein LTR85_000982 [Meristemomyces frigidus]
MAAIRRFSKRFSLGSDHSDMSTQGYEQLSPSQEMDLRNACAKVTQDRRASQASKFARPAPRDIAPKPPLDLALIRQSSKLGPPPPAPSARASNVPSPYATDDVFGPATTARTASPSVKAEVLRHRKTLSILSTTASEWARQISTEHARLLPSVLKCEDNLEHVERKKQELAQILERMEEVEAQLERLEGTPSVSMRPELAKSLAASGMSASANDDGDPTSGTESAQQVVRRKGYRIDRRGSSSSRLSLLLAAKPGGSPAKKSALHTPSMSRHALSAPSPNASPEKRTISKGHRKDMNSVCTLGSSIMSNTRPHTAIATAMPVLEAIPRMRMVQKKPRVLAAKSSLPDSLQAYDDQSSPNWRAMEVPPLVPKLGRRSVRQVTMLTPPSSVERSTPGSRLSLYPTISPPRISISPSTSPSSTLLPGQSPTPAVPLMTDTQTAMKMRDSVHSNLIDEATTVDVTVPGPSPPSPRPMSRAANAHKQDVGKRALSKKRNPVVRVLKRCFTLKRRSHAVIGTPKSELALAPKRRSLAGLIMRMSPSKSKATHHGADVRLSSIEHGEEAIDRPVAQTTRARLEAPAWQIETGDAASDMPEPAVTSPTAAATDLPTRQSVVTATPSMANRLSVDLRPCPPTSRDPSPLRSHPVSPRESSREWSKRVSHLDYMATPNIQPRTQDGRSPYVRLAPDGPKATQPATPPCSLHNHMKPSVDSFATSRSSPGAINFSRKRSSLEEPSWSSTTGRWWNDGCRGAADASPGRDSNARTIGTQASVL